MSYECWTMTWAMIGYVTGLGTAALISWYLKRGVTYKP